MDNEVIKIRSPLHSYTPAKSPVVPSAEQIDELIDRFETVTADCVHQAFAITADPGTFLASIEEERLLDTGPQPPESEPDPLEALEVYADAGLRLIRLHAKSKKPVADNWTAGEGLEAVREHVRIGGNYGALPDATRFFLDIDPRNGGDKSLERLARDCDFDPSVLPSIVTGGGGLHFPLTKPADVKLLYKLREYPGIEVKASGQVVGAGSVHPDTGQRYHWSRLTDARLAFSEGGLAEIMPAASPKLLELLSKQGVDRVGSTDRETISVSRLQACLDQIPVEEYRDRDAWLEVLMCCHESTGADPEACGAAIDWSQRDPLYPDVGVEVQERWVSFRLGKKDAVGVGTLFRLVQKHGGEIPPMSAAEVAEVFEDEPIERAPKSEPPRMLLSVSEFLERVKPAPPIIDGMLYGHGVGILFGPWGLGKSYLAMDLALHVVHGMDDWHGRRLYAAGRCAYLALEGEYSLPTRLRAWAQHHGQEIVRSDLLLYPGSLDLMKGAGRRRMLEELKEAQPTLVVVDTLSAGMVGVDENSSQEVSRALQWFRDVYRETEATVLAVHHPPKSNESVARGSGAIESNSDGVLRLAKSKSGSGLVLFPKKVRSGAPAPPLRLEFQAVDLGPDPDHPGRRLSESVIVQAPELNPDLEIPAIVIELAAETGYPVKLSDVVDTWKEQMGVQGTKAREEVLKAVPEKADTDSFVGLYRVQDGKRKPWFIHQAQSE